jgi:hypothetical protein
MATLTLGNVYVFNATPNQLKLTLNKEPLNQDFDGIAQTNGYAPVGRKVPRSAASANPGDATFGGKNRLVVSGSAQSYIVVIPPTIPLNKDVQLYLYSESCILVDPFGVGTSQEVVLDSTKIEA